MRTDAQQSAARHERIERFLEELRKDPVLDRLAAMAEESANTRLIVLLPAGESVLHVHVLGRPGEVPAFCRLVQESEEGRRRCSTCRSLLSIRATARGSGLNICHGGISAYKAPAGTVEVQNDLFAIVSTCAFRQQAARKDWAAVKDSLHGLPLRFHNLREAYLALPVLTPKRRKMIASIVETTAVAVAAIAKRCCGETQFDDTGGTVPYDLRAALKLAREDLVHEDATRRGALIVDTVTAILRRNPGARISVKALADAAGLTPNYFSAIFRDHSGKRFTDFLGEARIGLARELLGHPALRVKEIARRCGFSDSAYFARRFRQSTGLAPEAWRRAHPRRAQVTGRKGIATAAASKRE